MGGSHFGMLSTEKKVRERYVWKGIREEVYKYCRECEPCSMANPKNLTLPAELHPIPVLHIFERWGIDCVGPLKKTANG